MDKLSLTVIFLTLNEEFHIGEAIDNVRDIANEIFVLDSLSADKTVDIAIEKGAKVYQRRFTGFGDQWNAALQKLPITTEWTMKMDPDERLTVDLKREISSTIRAPEDFEAFDIVPALFFMGQSLHTEMIPVTRIWRTGSCAFSKTAVNEHLLVSGKKKCLKNRLLHLDCRDLHQWVDKQNRYTTAEAIKRFRGGREVVEPKLFGNFLQRRMWLKRVSHKVPFRRTMLFLYYYVIRGLWRVGEVGFQYSALRAWCGCLADQKVLEMRKTGREILLPPNRTGDYDSRCVRCD